MFKNLIQNQSTLFYFIAKVMMVSAKCSLFFSVISLTILQAAISQNEHHFQPQGEQNAQGRSLLDWVGLGTGPGTDPYLAKTNSACLAGDLAECFKSQALGSFDEFFNKGNYQLTEHARVLRMPETQLRKLAQEPFEFSDAPRADEPEWDQLLKFAMRRVEKFLKSSLIEVELDNEITEDGRYSPRFLDEIADEIDVIEDKKDSLFKRKQLKKLFIPMLIILKLFKLKLLLFLPLILGLASFKKLLGFLAIVIPGMIGFFKLCKPNLPSSNYYSGPHYSPAGIGYQQPQHHYSQPSFSQGYREDSSYDGQQHGNVHFGGGDDNHAQNLAYNGWGHYRNNGGDIKAESQDAPSSSTKKSILPDS